MKGKLEGLEKRYQELKAVHEGDCKNYEERLGNVEVEYKEQLSASQAHYSSLAEKNEELTKSEADLKSQSYEGADWEAC